MSHSGTRTEGLREQLTLRLLGAIEGFALAVLPRGRVRKRLLDRIEQSLQRIHRNRCGGVQER